MIKRPLTTISLNSKQNSFLIVTEFGPFLYMKKCTKRVKNNHGTTMCFKIGIKLVHFLNRYIYVRFSTYVPDLDQSIIFYSHVENNYDEKESTLDDSLLF